MDSIPNTKYIDHLLSLAGDAEAVEIQQARFDTVAEKISAKIIAMLRPETVASALLQIGIRDIERHNNTVDFKVSDFSGHARHLRALVAATEFSPVETSAECDVDELFQQCELLWKVLSDKLWIENLKPTNPSHPGGEDHRSVALSMSLLDIFQQEVNYYEFVRDHIVALYNGFSQQIIEPETKFSVVDAVNAFDYILDTLLPQRMESIGEQSEALRSKHEEFKIAARSFQSDADMDEWIECDPDRGSLAMVFTDRARRLDSLFIFEAHDFETVLGSKAAAFLDFFSFTPGTVNLQYKDPLDDDIVRSRPFAKLNKCRYCLVDIYRAGFSPLYRFPDLFESQKQKSRLSKRRDKLLETDAATYFGEVFQPELKAESYYIPFGEEGKRAERDLLLFRNGTLLVVESKAKPLRSIGQHRANLVKIRDDIKVTIKEAYMQTCSVIQYIDTCDETVPLLDKDGNVTATLAKSEIRHIVPVVFLDSCYGLFATDPTLWLSHDDLAGYPWIIDRDTFRTISLRIDSPEKLSEYLAWRLKGHGRFNEADEATIAGYYVLHGPVPLPAGDLPVQLHDGYDQVFDAAYFRSKGMDVPDPVADENPVWSTMRRVGDQLILEIDGKEHDRLNVHTGISHRDTLKERSKRRKALRNQLKKRKRKK